MADPRYPTPSLTRRLAGMAYEALLLLPLLLFTWLLPHILLASLAQRLATPGVLWLHLFLVMLVYFVWFWSKGRRTLPMKTWRIRLTALDGLPLRPGRAALRYLLCWPSFGLGGIGIVWALWDRDRQFLHDRLASTQLVSEGRKREER